MSKLLLDIRAGIASSVNGWRKTYPIQAAETEATIKKAAEIYPVGQPAIINIESWALPQRIEQYIQIVEWFREIRPDVRVGYYSLAPNGQGYWASILGDVQLKDWLAVNEVLKPLARVVDFVCPSLYSRYANGQGAYNHEAVWFSHFAPAMIKAAKDYTKQVYPFVWIRTSHPDVNYKVQSKELFQKQIQFCLDNADGVCIWDYINMDDSAKAIADTEEVMKGFSV